MPEVNRPYSEATVELAAQAGFQSEAARVFGPGSGPSWGEVDEVHRVWARESARAVLDALAEAGLLLPEGAETRAGEVEPLALHLDILAKRLRGNLEAQRAAKALAEQLRGDALPVVVVDEPGPDVKVVVDPFGNEVRRGRNGGWVWWGGRSGNRPEWSWEKVRDGFGPLVLPTEDPDA